MRYAICTLVLLACVLPGWASEPAEPLECDDQAAPGPVAGEAQPDWQEQAGKCVLAPMSCADGVKCTSVEKKFLKKVQDILPVGDPEELRSAFLERSIDSPTKAQVLAVAGELKYDSVILADAQYKLLYRRQGEEAWRSSLSAKPPTPGGEMPARVERSVSGWSHLTIETIDGALLVYGVSPEWKPRSRPSDWKPRVVDWYSPGELMRRQLLEILKDAA